MWMNKKTENENKTKENIKESKVITIDSTSKEQKKAMVSSQERMELTYSYISLQSMAKDSNP